MWRRIGTVLGARLRSGPKGGLPVSAWLSQALIASVFCALVGDRLPPFAYGLFAFSLSGALLALPLLGELGWLLRRDPASEWIGAQPVRTRELNLARVLHLLLLLGALALASLIPAAIFAPTLVGPGMRLLFPLLGLGFAFFLAALLLFVQSLLGERAEGLLVLVQTVLVVGIVVGLVSGLRAVPALARLPTLGDSHATYLWLFPPCWFAAPLAALEGEPPRAWLPGGVALLSLAGLFLMPAPAAARRQAGRTWLELLLEPVRRLALAVWVRKEERAPFELVYAALPREREVVLRTVPMIGIPLAFLIVSARGGEGTDVLALLMFTVPVYLPILLTHVPATSTPRAAWILETAPLERAQVVHGTIKALTVRFLVPLYVLLAFVAGTQAGIEWTLRLALPGFLTSLLAIRILYPVCVSDPPLSRSPDELRFDLDWIGVLGGLALALTLLALLANRWLVDPLWAALLPAALLGAEILGNRVSGASKAES